MRRIGHKAWRQTDALTFISNPSAYLSPSTMFLSDGFFPVYQKSLFWLKGQIFRLGRYRSNNKWYREVLHVLFATWDRSLQWIHLLPLLGAFLDGNPLAFLVLRYQNPGLPLVMKLSSCPAALHKEDHATQNFLTDSAWTMDFYALCFSRCFEDPTSYIRCDSDTMDDVGKIYHVFHMRNCLEITNICVSHSSPCFWATWGEVEQHLILTVQISNYIQQSLNCMPLAVPRCHILHNGQIGRWIL